MPIEDCLRGRVFQQLGNVGERANAEASGEGGGTLGIGVADGDEFRFGQLAQGRRVNLSDFAAANKGGANWIHGQCLP